MQLKGIFLRKPSSFAEASLFSTFLLIVYNLICILDYLQCVHSLKIRGFILEVCAFFEDMGLCSHLSIRDLTEAV